VSANVGLKVRTASANVSSWVAKGASMLRQCSKASARISENDFDIVGRLDKLVRRRLRLGAIAVPRPHNFIPQMAHSHQGVRLIKGICKNRLQEPLLRQRAFVFRSEN